MFELLNNMKISGLTVYSNAINFEIGTIMFSV